MASDFTSIAAIAERYAQALFDLAQDEKSLDAIARDLEGLKTLIEGSADLTRLIRSPVFTREEQAGAMAAVLDKVGVNPLTRKFARFLAEQRRLYALPQMATAFLKLLAATRGEMSAEVTSANALSANQVAALKATLKDSFKRAVALNTHVDPSLLGGIVVRVGSRMIDSSLRTKLSNLAVALKGTP